MPKPHRFVATGLKLAICLIAILAILYAQAWVESFGGGYGGPLRTQVGYRYSDLIVRSDLGGSDVFFAWGIVSSFIPYYPWNTEQGGVLILALALLIGLYLWHTLWAAPRRRERLLAAELRPMSRLVGPVVRPSARKAASGNKHKRSLSRTPLWP